MKSQGDIVIFKNSLGQPDIEVRFENDTLWLDQYQISTLFETDRTSILRHIKKVYKSQELEESSTCAFFTQVQQEGKRKIKREIKTYNLDLIISVGYRVNSIRGTQFRIWANNILKNYLTKGYALNEKKLKQQSHQLTQLKQSVSLISRVVKSNIISDTQTTDILDILTEYTKALDLLDDYDHQRITKTKTSEDVVFKINYEDAIKAIEQLRVKFGASNLFGNQKDQSFKSSIAVIDQTFDQKELYPSIEEKAANLLYLVVKNHSFTDGNKRIAAWLFIWYLNENNYLYTANGAKKIGNNTLVALTLMIAESNPTEKDILIHIIINLIHTEDE